MNWQRLGVKIQRAMGLHPLKIRSTPDCYICGRHIEADWTRALDEHGSMCIACHDNKYKPFSVLAKSRRR